MSELESNKNPVTDVVDANSSQSVALNEKDNSLYYFSEKAKKMVTAVYIVSNLIHQTDPLRQTIREFSVRLMVLIGIRPANQSITEVSIEIKNLCKNIVGLLEVAFFSGYISEMNFSVLKSEFDIFMNEISNFKNLYNTIDKNSLQVNIGFDRIVQNNYTYGSTSRQHEKFQNMASNIAKKAPDNHVLGSVSKIRKTSRKESIISIIKKKGKVSIKDISSVILNCSEKTIQRELQMLVNVGTIKKSGDRRWSVYSIV